VSVADLRHPYDWDCRVRAMSRKFILHVGPTNSGKTHAALVALSNARVGAYAGPLRLLAHEIYSRFNEGRVPGLDGPRACSLLTGEDRREIEGAGLISCTVEMLPPAARFDVVVVDEIQMISDPHRGDAWTSALHSVNATEVHLCGEESAVELVQRICKKMGDEVEVRRYQRLSKLEVADDALYDDFSLLKPGDCIVTFSRRTIFDIKKRIEEETKLKVAVAYGGLPPEVREKQASMFNAGEYDVIVASDAIGMGLNLFVFSPHVRMD
jgi:ATP-dependent RNA helicase SUPV3L1/SUV3